MTPETNPQNHEQVPSKPISLSGGRVRILLRGFSEDEDCASPDTSERRVRVYRTCEMAIEHGGEELHNLSLEERILCVAAVVDVESPVHSQVVARRIVEAAGFQRVGPLAKDTIDDAAAVSARTGRVRQRGPFFWRPDMPEPCVRDRSQLPQEERHIDWIAPEELAAALGIAAVQTGTDDLDELERRAASLLGFSRFGSAIERTISVIAEGMLRSGELVLEEGLYTYRGGTGAAGAYAGTGGVSIPSDCSTGSAYDEIAGLIADLPTAENRRAALSRVEGYGVQAVAPLVDAISDGRLTPFVETALVDVAMHVRGALGLIYSAHSSADPCAKRALGHVLDRIESCSSPPPCSSTCRGSLPTLRTPPRPTTAKGVST